MQTTTYHDEVQSENLQYVITERDEEIAKIKEDLKEVNQLFQSIASYIDSQSDTVDIITTNISNAKDNTHNAAKNLQKAENVQKSESNWWLYATGGITGVIVSVAGIVASLLLL